MKSVQDETLEGNCWRYNARRHVLQFRERPNERFYEVALNSITTSASALDWIVQISQKAWATPKVVGDLVRRMDAILNLQGNYCSAGIERGPVDVTKLLC